MHPAIASSIALREGSADWSANAFAGESAKAYDASTAFSNPAGMTRLNWNETDLSFTVVAPSSNFAAPIRSADRSRQDRRVVTMPSLL